MGVQRNKSENANNSGYAWDVSGIACATRLNRGARPLRMGGHIHRKLLSNRLNVYPMKGRLISGLSSWAGVPEVAAAAVRAAWAALSRVALSV